MHKTKGVSRELGGNESSVSSHESDDSSDEDNEIKKKAIKRMQDELNSDGDENESQA